MKEFEAGKVYGDYLLVTKKAKCTPFGADGEKVIGVIKYQKYGQVFKDILFTDGKTEYFYAYSFGHSKTWATDVVSE